MQDEILGADGSSKHSLSDTLVDGNESIMQSQQDDNIDGDIQPLREFKSIQGEPDQVCENQEILTLIQSRYTHILSNEFKGNASGKIGKAEAMICDCVYDKGALETT